MKCPDCPPASPLQSLASELAVVCVLAKLEPSAVHVVASNEEAAAAGASGAGVVSLVVGDGVQVC